MSIAVCTLFEGTYHHGVAVLVNSLCSRGFRGHVYAGFRGPVPPWAHSLTRIPLTMSGEAPSWQAFEVTDGVQLVFVPFPAVGHLTNRKPDFMLQLFAQAEPNLGGLFYLDPDIVVTEHWRFFQEWLSCGIALCEDVNSPLHENSPPRVGWRRFYRQKEVVLRFRSSAYANGGLVGVMCKDLGFLRLWARLQELMFEVTGGPSKAGIAGGESVANSAGFANCFDKTDQDALNATIEAWDGTVSMLGRQAMGFAAGSANVPHALGPRKPWAASYMSEALSGRPPSAADKAFWSHCQSPIQVFPQGVIRRRKFEINLASAIGRFCRRS